MSDTKKIAFLGLGVMGGPMAAHLARAGHEVTVYNRTTSKAEEWIASRKAEGLPARLALTPADAAAEQDVVVTCLGNDDDLLHVLFRDKDNAFKAIRKDALFIDHTTVSPRTAKFISYEALEIPVLAVDAPVSGGQAGAENGKLAIMCGGTDAAMAAAEPVMQAYAARVVHIGPAGAGQGAKAINQVCIAGVLAGLSEGVRLAQASGLDSDKVLEAISGGAAQSWQMENRWQTMMAGEFDFGFAIDWMRKDLAIAMAEASEHGLDLPITELVDSYYARVQEMGGNRQDTSALIRHLPEVGE